MSRIRILKKTTLSDEVTRDQVSTIAETSIANNGNQVLLTGNWFAARSLNSGNKWSYISPFSYFPEESGFCCDQTVLFDDSWNLTFWLLQYVESGGSNILRLAVKKGKTLHTDKWDIWDFTPQTVNSGWRNQWMDYNHAALSDHFLYIGTNIFNTSDRFTRSVILRISLDQLAAGDGVTFDYYASTSSFSLKCVQKAGDTMYFAAHAGTTGHNKLRVFSWKEQDTNVSQVDIPVTPWSGGNGYTARCPDHTNWLSRADYRITGAWFANSVMGFMWTANRRGQSRPWPHIRVARINVASMKLLDEPDIWSPDYAYAYPDAAVNGQGDVGMTAVYGGGTKFPSMLVGYYDEGSGKWEMRAAVTGTNGPADSKWGDYVSIRPYTDSKTAWIAAGFTLQGGKTVDNVQVHMVRFARR